MNTRSKRAFDLFFSIVGLLFLSPVFGLLAAAVKLSDGGPVFYRQQRVGQGGRLFAILKFRSMLVNAEKMGLSVTKEGDPRVTRMGRLMRKSKLDELPQLWNVLRGDMSLVGPRPEVPHYVEQYTAGQKRVLALKPGITDLATLEFRNEEELLNTAADTEKFYIEHCLPRKIELNLAYAEKANAWEDIKIIFRTLWPLEAGRKREAMKAESKEQKAESGRGA